MVIPPEISDAAPGAIGAILSLHRVPGRVAKAVALAGGMAFAWYAAGPVAQWLGANSGALGLTKLALGFFSMALAGKVWDGIASIDAPAIGRAITDRVNKLLESKP